MDVARRLINGDSNPAQHGYVRYEKKRNGPSLGLNGIRCSATATCTNSVPEGCASNWNRTDRMSAKELDGNIRMRPKKAKQQQQEIETQTVRPSSCIRFRPVSTNSYTSLASSGMSDIRWRNSHISSCGSSTPSSWQLIHESPNSWKHEGYLDEEKEMIGRGMESAKKLTAWYHERLKSVQKRASLLGRGLVPVDGAVHEQRLNYLRAHIAELNRRITSLVESSDRAFPTHSNLQVRTQMPQPNDDRSEYYRRQNIKLCQELAHKDKVIEQLIRDKAEANDNYSAIRKVEPRRIMTIPAPEHHYTQLYSLASPKVDGTLM